MRLVFLISLIAATAACQPISAPIQKPIDNGITPAYVASLPPEQSRPAVNQLANEVVAAETNECRENPDIDWESCVSARMLVSFDRYGFLTNHCRDQANYKALRECVLFGRSGVDWLLALGGNPDTEFDWSRPQQSHDAVLKKLNDVLTEKCADKPEGPGNSCFTSESARLLGLGDVVAAHCSARPELTQRGACIIDAHDAAMYQSALAWFNR